MKRKEAKMAVAGAVVIPINRDMDNLVVEKLQKVEGVTVEDSGPKGIAVVIEAPSTSRLKEISEEINQWEEVIGFELVYLNWE